MKRRSFLAGLGGASLVGLSGCLGAAGLAEHESTPAGVEPPVRQDTGYEQTGIDPLEITEELAVAGYSEEVTVTNYITEHEKEVDLGPLGSQRAAVFMVLTTPQVSIAGQEFNPVGDMSSDELVDLVADNYDQIENVQRDAEETVTVLGQETPKTRFEADAQFDGQDVEVYLHITEAVETAEDLLVTIAVYPQRFHDREGDNVGELVSGVVEETDGEPSSDSGGDSADGNESSTGGDDGGSETETATATPDGGGGGNDTSGGSDNETSEDDDGLLSL